MKFLRLILRKYKSNSGVYEDVDASVNLDAITYVDMANRSKLIIRFQGDMNLYFVEDADSVARLLAIIDKVSIFSTITNSNSEKVDD